MQQFVQAAATKHLYTKMYPGDFFFFSYSSRETDLSLLFTQQTANQTLIYFFGTHIKFVKMKHIFVGRFFNVFFHFVRLFVSFFSHSIFISFYIHSFFFFLWFYRSQYHNNIESLVSLVNIIFYLFSLDFYKIFATLNTAKRVYRYFTIVAIIIIGVMACVRLYQPI